MSQTSNIGIKIAIAVKGPYVIDNNVTEIRAKPPPEKPDFDIANNKTEKDTIK